MKNPLQTAIRLYKRGYRPAMHGENWWLAVRSEDSKYVCNQTFRLMENLDSQQKSNTNGNTVL
jgi:hypothetical protein